MRLPQILAVTIAVLGTATPLAEPPAPSPPEKPLPAAPPAARGMDGALVPGEIQVDQAWIDSARKEQLVRSALGPAAGPLLAASDQGFQTVGSVAVLTGDA